MAQVGFGAFGVLKLIADLIREQAALLDRVPDDVRFITDEVESMSNQLRHLVETRELAGNYQVRSWTNQVMEFALETKECLDQYARGDGGAQRALDLFPMVASGLLTGLEGLLNHRTRFASRIHKLRLRAIEIAERQKRYADSVPPMREDGSASGVANNHQLIAIGQSGRHQYQHQQTHVADRDRDDVRRAVLSEPDMLTRDTKELIKWLKEEPASNGGDPIRVVAIVAPDAADGATLANEVYKHFKHFSDDDRRMFELKLSITVKRPPTLFEILLAMLSRLHCEDDILTSAHVEQWDEEQLKDKIQNMETWGDDQLKAKLKAKHQDLETWDDKQLKTRLRALLRGKKLLLVISDIDYTVIWVQIKEALDSLNCSAGSTVLFSTKDTEVARRCSSTSSANFSSAVGRYLKKALSANRTVVASRCYSSTKTKLYSNVDFYLKKAASLVSDDYSDAWRLERIKEILQKCDPDIGCMDLLLRALYSNPNRTEQELQSLSESLGPRCTNVQKEDRMIAFCYEGLPKHYKICLWYSIVCTPRRDHVRRASLVRRWVAEDLITKVGESSALEEAERCFDMLITQKLLSPELCGGTGKIKSYEVPDLVIDKIGEEIPTLEDLVLTNQLPLEPFEILFSLRSLFKLHQASSMLTLKKDSLRESMSTRQKESMIQFLKSVKTSPSSQHMRVLDLEDYKHLKENHLKNICKIHKLRYLSLRNTDVMELPRQIKKLECLETLDIRQTRVRALNAILPKLKHLLVGRTDCPKKDIVKSKESFSTTRMPRDVAAMEFLEILSHVEVSDSAKEFIMFGRKLQKLRKLGVVFRGKKTNLKDLLLQIEKLHDCLLSLSIIMEEPGNWEEIDVTELVLPELESLNICGIRGALPHQVKRLHHLAKITLRDTGLKADALDILGVLKGLNCLRLRYHSFAEDALTFLDRQFSCLIDLVIEDDILKSITFAPGTAPMLKKMVWSFTNMKSLSGVGSLPSLTHLDLNRGKCDQDGLRKLQKDIDGPYNRKITFNLNPPDNVQGSEQPGPAPRYC